DLRTGGRHVEYSTRITELLRANECARSRGGRRARAPRSSGLPIGQRRARSGRDAGGDRARLPESRPTLQLSQPAQAICAGGSVVEIVIVVEIIVVSNQLPAHFARGIVHGMYVRIDESLARGESER